MKKIINMIKGDTLSFTFEIENFTEELDTCYFSCKKDVTDNNYIFQKSLNNGITKIDTGKYKVRVAPEDTKNVLIGNYQYDLQIGINNDIYTIMNGLLTIEQEITEES